MTPITRKSRDPAKNIPVIQGVSFSRGPRRGAPRSRGTGEPQSRRRGRTRARDHSTSRAAAFRATSSVASANASIRPSFAPAANPMPSRIPSTARSTAVAISIAMGIGMARGGCGSPFAGCVSAPPSVRASPRSSCAAFASSSARTASIVATPRAKPTAVYVGACSRRRSGMSSTATTEKHDASGKVEDRAAKLRAWWPDGRDDTGDERRDGRPQDERKLLQASRIHRRDDTRDCDAQR